MACDFPRCECMCHPDDCVFLEKNQLRFRGNRMNELSNEAFPTQLADAERKRYEAEKKAKQEADTKSD